MSSSQDSFIFDVPNIKLEKDEHSFAYTMTNYIQNNTPMVITAMEMVDHNPYRILVKGVTSLESAIGEHNDKVKNDAKNNSSAMLLTGIGIGAVGGGLITFAIFYAFSENRKHSKKTVHPEYTL